MSPNRKELKERKERQRKGGGRVTGECMDGGGGGAGDRGIFRYI